MNTLSKRLSSVVSVSVSFAALWLVACTPTEPTGPTEPPSSSSSSSASSTSTSNTEPTFAIRADAVGAHHVGVESHLSVRIEGRRGWHMNTEFPTQVTPTHPNVNAHGAGTEAETAAAVQFPKASLGNDDAAEFTDQFARFDVPFTATEAGPTSVQLALQFAVCTDTSCTPQSETVDVMLTVSE